MHPLHPSFEVMTALLTPGEPVQTSLSGGRMRSCPPTPNARLPSLPSDRCLPGFRIPSGSSPPVSLSVSRFHGLLLPSPRGLTASEFLIAAFGIPALALRGRLGDRVFKTYGDKIVITRIPQFDGYVPSAAQCDQRAKMRAATAYARAVYADPAAKAFYVAAARNLGRQPFRLDLSDFLRGHARVTIDVARSAPPAKRKRSLRNNATMRRACDLRPVEGTVKRTTLEPVAKTPGFASKPFAGPGPPVALRFGWRDGGRRVRAVPWTHPPGLTPAASSWPGGAVLIPYFSFNRS
jgi:hypothetical protein